MLKTVAVTAVALLAVAAAIVVAIASTRPDHFSVQRSTTIAARPERVFALVNDFHQWPSWSPWEHLDPKMKRRLSGTSSGTGAAYSWEGSGKVGAGRMEITGSTPPSQVTIQLDFMRPFEAHNVTVFTLTPRAGATDVTWSMQGPSPFVARAMGVFVSMDRTIGEDFENGLANMKAAAEK